MERYASSEDTPIDGYWVRGDGLVPAEFADIKARRIRPREANILLEGCLDEFVVLTFTRSSNRSASAGNRMIVLTYHVGVYETKDEVIWREKAAEPGATDNPGSAQ